jgi:hypothetical protein
MDNPCRRNHASVVAACEADTLRIVLSIVVTASITFAVVSAYGGSRGSAQQSTSASGNSAWQHCRRESIGETPRLGRNEAAAGQLGTRPATVSKWRGRFARHRIWAISPSTRSGGCCASTRFRWRGGVAGAWDPKLAERDFANQVDIGGGRKLYLECRGTGSPTVILESGYYDSLRPSANARMICARNGERLPVGQRAHSSTLLPPLS